MADDLLLDAPPLNWGILAPGNIARDFASSVLSYTSQRIIAAGSRSILRARQFTEEFGIDRAYGSYEDLLADEDVDVIYVASPHSHHKEHALAAIRAGKHVLVEKAFTRNQAEAREVQEAAAEERVFVMEAMWTRFLPHMVKARRLVADGALGEIITVLASFGEAFAFDPASRLFDPRLAGGALLDLGIYPVSFACDMLGLPASITAQGSLTETGVDGQVAIQFGYETRACALLDTTLWAAGANTAEVRGTEGRIEIGRGFFAPSDLTLIRKGKEPETFCAPPPLAGHHYQAAEVARRVAAGELYSPVMSPTESVQIMGILDEIRRQVGVTYPGEDSTPR